MTVDDTTGVLTNLLRAACQWNRLTICGEAGRPGSPPDHLERIAATMARDLDLTGWQLVDTWVEPDPPEWDDPTQRLEAVVARCASGAPAELPRRAKLISGKLIPPPPDRRPLPAARPSKRRRRSPPVATPASTVGP